MLCGGCGNCPTSESGAKEYGVGRVTILGGDLPRSSEFYINPGSLGGLAVAELAQADPGAAAKLGLGKPVGFGPKVYFLVTFADGRRALAAADPRTYDRLQRDIAGGPVAAETVADRKKENTRTGVIFVAVYFVSLYVFARYLTGYYPFLAAFAAGAAAALAGNILFSKLKR